MQNTNNHPLKKDPQEENLILHSLLLKHHNRIIQLLNPLPNPQPHLVPNLRLNIRRIVLGRRSPHPTIIRLRLLRLVRLGRRADIARRVEAVGGEELV